MQYFLLILLCAIASCTEPLAPTKQLCVQYKIGNASTTSTVKFANGFVVCDNWRLSISSTQNNQTRLFKDTVVIVGSDTVYNSVEFLFGNNQIGDTVRGVYVSHNKGKVCNTYDTLPVVVTKVPCKQSPFGNP